MAAARAAWNQFVAILVRDPIISNRPGTVAEKRNLASAHLTSALEAMQEAITNGLDRDAALINEFFNNGYSVDTVKRIGALAAPGSPEAQRNGFIDRIYAARPPPGTTMDLNQWVGIINGNVATDNIMYTYKNNIWSKLTPVPPAGADNPNDQLPTASQLRNIYNKAVFESFTTPGANPDTRNLKQFAGTANAETKNKEAAKEAATAHFRGIKAALDRILLATARPALDAAVGQDPGFRTALSRGPNQETLAREVLNTTMRIIIDLLNRAGLKGLPIDYDSFPFSFIRRGDSKYEGVSVRGFDPNSINTLADNSREVYYIAYASTILLPSKSSQAEIKENAKKQGEGAVVAFLSTIAGTRGSTGQIYPEILDIIRQLVIPNFTPVALSGQVSIGPMQFFGEDPVLKQKHWRGPWNSRKTFHDQLPALTAAFATANRAGTRLYPNTDEGKDAFLHNVLNALERSPFVKTGPYNAPRTGKGSTITINGGRHRKTTRRNRRN